MAIITAVFISHRYMTMMLSKLFGNANAILLAQISMCGYPYLPSCFAL